MSHVLVLFNRLDFGLFFGLAFMLKKIKILGMGLGYFSKYDIELKAKKKKVSILTFRLDRAWTKPN